MKFEELSNNLIDSSFSYNFKSLKKKLNNNNKYIYNEIQTEISSKNLKNQKCSICNSDKFFLINENDRYGFYYPTGICSECGLIQQTKYFTDNFINKFYSDYYNKFYAHFKSPQQRFLNQYESGRRILNYSKELLKNKEIKILEIGCGAGGILKYFKDYGYRNVKGIDYDIEQLDYGRKNGLDLIHVDDFDHLLKFDFIILSHVLEHLSKPNEEINNIKKYLGYNSLLYIEVPSIHSIKDLNYNYDIRKFFHIAHVTHFSLNSFKNFIFNAGFKVVKINDQIESILKLDDKFQNNFKYTSTLNKDFIELVSINNYFKNNKINLFMKKLPIKIHYYLRSSVINILPNFLYLLLKKIYKKNKK